MNYVILEKGNLYGNYIYGKVLFTVGRSIQNYSKMAKGFIINSIINIKNISCRIVGCIYKTAETMQMCYRTAWDHFKENPETLMLVIIFLFFIFERLQLDGKDINKN